MWKEPMIFLEFDLNEHSVLAALLIDSKDFCGYGSHLWTLSTSDFAGDGNRPQRASGTDRHQRRRESRADTRACRRRSRVLFQKAAIRYRRNHLFPIGPKMQLLLPKRISLSRSIEGQAVIPSCERSSTTPSPHVAHPLIHFGNGQNALRRPRAAIPRLPPMRLDSGLTSF